MSAAQGNRLARETSPYLLQHAHNPVDWYPWGAEALERAQASSTLENEEGPRTGRAQSMG